jgi:ABC-type transport system involved in cytochrome bd biosynthesis fused ATPase/permease subunit
VINPRHGGESRNSVATAAVYKAATLVNSAVNFILNLLILILTIEIYLPLSSTRMEHG